MKIKLTLDEISAIIIYFLILVFISSIFTPELMFSKTITSGGDTASHYLPAKILMDEMLPQGRLIKWFPNWYAGIPLFQSYFLPPFIAMALLGYVIGLEISFKLITISGIVMLPALIYFMSKNMGHSTFTSTTAMTLSLIPLFLENHSMWGGNIPSTLAGEFSHMISISLAFLFLGTLKKGVEQNIWWKTNTLLFALIALTHVYTVLWIIAITPAYTIKNWCINLKKLEYIISSYATAFFLTAFWGIPMILRMEYTTPYALRWNITETILPPLLMPLTALAILGILIGLIHKKKSTSIHVISIVAASLCYLLGPHLGLVDIRFIPFIYITLAPLAAYAISIPAKKLKVSYILSYIIFFTTIFWVSTYQDILVETEDGTVLHTENIFPRLKNQTYTGYIPHWVKWNYEGFEAKPTWRSFMKVNNFLNGTIADPRVKFEHNAKINSAGTVRAFESIPLFANRNILEGLYLHAGITPPSIFYIQSEVSEQQSCPFWAKYPCTRFNLDDGTKHLRMYNVQYIVASSTKLKKALDKHQSWMKRLDANPYEVWELTDNTGSYVTVPLNTPNIITSNDWKNIYYEWFKRMDLIDTPLVYIKHPTPTDMKVFGSPQTLNSIQKNPLPQNCDITEEIEDEKIFFTTDCIGIPHIISVSYYPSWNVEGAEKIHMASPGFMMVVPTKNQVTLTYAKQPIDIIGILFTITAFAALYTEKRWRPKLIKSILKT